MKMALTLNGKKKEIFYFAPRTLHFALELAAFVGFAVDAGYDVSQLGISVNAVAIKQSLLKCRQRR